MRRNEAMNKRKELKRKDPRVQVYVKYPAIVMVKRPGETAYGTHAEI